jgi:hypothetical protein
MEEELRGILLEAGLDNLEITSKILNCGIFM